MTILHRLMPEFYPFRVSSGKRRLRKLIYILGRRVAPLTRREEGE